MRAITLDFESRSLTERDVAEPRITRADHVLFRVHEVGICGTDRELVSFRIGSPPPGDSYLTIGHEALGQVMEVGPAVSDFREGDWVVPAIRRPCAALCRPCSEGRTDLCLTGEFRERGIARQHGYFTELAVDSSDDLILIPPDVVDRAVLLEPLSVVEKAAQLGTAAHLPYYRWDPPRALVLGAGTIGILAALVLRKRGFETAICSQEPKEHRRARLIETAGVSYLNGIEKENADLILEATGSAEAAMAGLRALAPSGVMVILGAPNATVEFPFRDLILRNQAVLGSVNSSPEAFRQALGDLVSFDAALLDQMILRVAFKDYQQTIIGPLAERPKVVHVMAG